MLAAPAVDWSGFYVGIEGGGVIGSGQAYAGPFNPVPGNVTNSLSMNGGLLGGTVGYNWLWTPNWLLGIEGDGSWVDRSGTGPSIPPFNPAFLQTYAERHLLTLRARLGYLLNDRWLVYATAGAAENSVKLTDFDPAVAGLTASQSQGEWGWTAGAGAEMKLIDNWSVKLEYLYAGFSDRTYFNPVPNAAFVPDQKLRLSENIVRVGLNYHFNAPLPSPPAPAAMPAPPPAAAKVFIVFFDWDKDTITPEGQQIIRQAADAYRAGVPVQIQVTGYTDRSGSPGYNQRLSERRANNVARALAALGVPKDQMAVSGRGENDNRVPTAPGVREPQNRRVEIVSP